MIFKNVIIAFVQVADGNTTESASQVNNDSNQDNDIPAELAFLDPDREQNKQYMLVLRKDYKLCPKRVTRCQQCQIAFTEESDKFVIKTRGMRERPPDKGGKKLYEGNVYLHFLTDCLKKWDKKFKYEAVIVPNSTKEKTQDKWKPYLRKRGIKI